MAVYFEVLACTGTDREAAQSLAAALAARTEVLSCHAFEAQAVWWVCVVPRGLSYAAPADQGFFIEEEDRRTAIATDLEAALSSAVGVQSVQSGFELEEALCYPDPEDG